MRTLTTLGSALVLVLAAAGAYATDEESPPAIAAPGDCAVPKPHFAVLGVPGEAGVALVPTERCDLDCVAGNPSDRLTPTDVAAAPPGSSVGVPSTPSNPILSGCLVGNCGPRTPQGPVGIVEPPAVIGLPPGLPGVPGGNTP